LTSETHNNNSKKKELFRRDLITQESIGRRWEREGSMDGYRMGKKLTYTEVEEEKHKMTFSVRRES
jgi:hypothetical protein